MKLCFSGGYSEDIQHFMIYDPENSVFKCLRATYRLNIKHLPIKETNTWNTNDILKIKLKFFLNEKYKYYNRLVFFKKLKEEGEPKCNSEIDNKGSL